MEKDDESLPDFKPSPKIQGGVGIMYAISPTLSLKGFAESNLVFSDTVDYYREWKTRRLFFKFWYRYQLFIWQKKNKKLNRYLN